MPWLRSVRVAAIAAPFIEIWRARDPSLEVDTLDLWREPLPDFDGDFYVSVLEGIKARR